MTEEDFDRLLVMIEGLRLPVLEDPRPHTGVQDVVLFIPTLSLNFAQLWSCAPPVLSNMFHLGDSRLR